MRSVAGWIGALWLVAGCTVPSDVAKTCSSDGDCGPNGICDLSVGLCYAADTEPPVDPTACSPLCPDYQVCTRRGCVARFEGLTLQTPAENVLVDGGPVQVVARLTVNEAYRVGTRFPAMLEFRSEVSGGALGGTFANFSHDDAGTYNVVWTPPTDELQVTLVAAHPVPDAGLRDTKTVRVDAVPPVLTVSVPPPSLPASDGGTVYADPGAGALSNLWVRDQQVTVEIRTNEPNLDKSSLKVALRGTDGALGPSVAVTEVTTNCVELFCGEAQLNLWEPKFDAFRGPLTVEVEARDLAGNVGTTSPSPAQVNVTRWRWAFNLPSGIIKASPAIGEKGTVYVGTSDGKVVAVNPDGTKAWEAATVGAVGSLAVGAQDGGVEFIYAAANATNNKAVLYAFSSEDGGTRVRCPGSGEHVGPIVGSIAITTLGTVPNRFESGAAVVNSGGISQLWIVRPEAASSLQCVVSNSVAGIPETTQDSSLIASGSTFFYPAGDATIVSYISFSNMVNWQTQPVSHPIVGLTLTGGSLVGGGVGSTSSQGGLYSVPSTGSSSATLLSGTSGGRVWHPIIGAGGTNAFYGQETSSTQGSLKKYDLQNQTVAPTSPSLGVLKYAPALGADGVLYAAPSSSSDVTARSANDLSERWTVTLGFAASASVALDCARAAAGALVPNKPGTLYVPAGGTLNAIIVDSPGLNRDTAAWPKYQHDARNTGNPATVGPNCQ